MKKKKSNAKNADVKLYIYLCSHKYRTLYLRFSWDRETHNIRHSQITQRIAEEVIPLLLETVLRTFPLLYNHK